jgi:diacylglycerol kinase family enzyme
MRIFFNPRETSENQERWSRWIRVRTGNAERPDAFVIAGGDGTLNKFINELWPRHRDGLFGFVGIGSNNSILKSFFSNETIASEPLANLNFERIRKVDLVQVENARGLRFVFLANASIGLLADCNRAFNTPISRRLGRLSMDLANFYAFCAGLWGNRPLHLKIQSGGQIYEGEFSQLQILKGPVFAGDFRCRFPYRPDSGTFWVYGLRAQSKLKLLLKFIAWGLRPGVEFADLKFETSEVSIESTTEIGLEYDGEMEKSSRFRFQCLREALNVGT